MSRAGAKNAQLLRYPAVTKLRTIDVCRPAGAPAESEDAMPDNAAIVSVFDRYRDADAAVKTLSGAGFPMRDLGIIGSRHHTEFAAAAPQDTMKRTKRWAARAAFAGALAALMLGLFSTPAAASGSIPLLGYLAALAVYGIEGAVVLGGLGIAGALLLSFLARNSGAIGHGRVTRADGYLVIVRGSEEQTARARTIVGANF
jgi:hypothetical protein